jgi:acid phosphatase
VQEEGPRPTVGAVEATIAAEVADPAVMLAAEPVANFGVARYRLADYAECLGTIGCYWTDLKVQTERAQRAFGGLVASKKAGEKLAIVLDIDETSLSNYCELKREDFGYIGTLFGEWMESAEALPIQGTLQLFNKALAAGVDVFFITGRADKYRAATVKNLEAAGYKGWKGLSLRVGQELDMSTVDYKSSERKKIVDAGYRIIMSVGDQWSDLEGSPKAEVSVKLPNPFYYLP